MERKSKKVIVFVIVILAIGLIAFAFLLKEKKYNVIFSNLGSTNSVEVSKDGYVTKPTDPVRDGYKFIGWYNNDKLYNFNEKVTSDLKLEAKWEKVEETAPVVSTTKYKITFNNEDGTVINTVEVSENGIVTKPDDPTKEGYNFVGWYNGDVAYTFTETLKSDITLTAKFEKITDNVKTYKIVFNTDGGSKVATKTVEENKTVSKPTNPTKTGYSFVSWQLDGKDYNFSSKVTNDITLKAKWKALAKYTVKFNTDGGSTIKDVTVYEGGKVTKPTNPTKSGYNFSKWQLDGKDYNFNNTVTKNITLKAVWTEKTKCTVTFNSDGGSSVDSKTLYCGDQIGSLPTPTKSGNTFNGWYSGNTKYTAKTKVTANVTLKASWINNDLANVNKALASLSNKNITKGGQTLSASYSGCTITLTPESSIAKIERGTSDKNINITAKATCGRESGTKTIKGIIKASTLKYTAVANDNQVNYNVKVFDGSSSQTNYKLYNTSGSYLATYNSNDGYAAVSNKNITGYPNFKLIFNNDSNTTYVVSKK